MNPTDIIAGELDGDTACAERILKALYQAGFNIGVRSSMTEAEERSQQGWEEFRRKAIEQGLVPDVRFGNTQKLYTTTDVAKFFGLSPKWVLRGVTPDAHTGEQLFCYADGTPINIRRSPMGKQSKRLFTLNNIREIALCWHRRGNLTDDEAHEIMGKILVAEFGEYNFQKSS